jgi:hypothetical protein
LDSCNCTMTGASSGPRRGTEDQARAARARKSGTGRRLRRPGKGEAIESYFDEVLRDPRRYGIENTTDKVRGPGAVRPRDAVCTERIVGLTGSNPQELVVAVSYFWPGRRHCPRNRRKHLLIVERASSAGGPRIHVGRHPVGRRPLLLGRILRFPGVVFGAHFPDSPHPETGQLRRPGLPDSLSRALREQMSQISRRLPGRATSWRRIVAILP